MSLPICLGLLKLSLLADVISIKILCAGLFLFINIKQLNYRHANFKIVTNFMQNGFRIKSLS